MQSIFNNDNFEEKSGPVALAPQEIHLYQAIHGNIHMHQNTLQLISISYTVPGEPYCELVIL